MRLTEKFHPSHEEHALKLTKSEAPWQCDACKQPGSGEMYACDECNFHLHYLCALAKDTLTHPLHRDGCCAFELHDRAPGRRRRFCDACGETAAGLVYHCACGSRDLHPCCAELDRFLPTDDDGDVLLLSKSKSNVTLNVSCVRRMVARGSVLAYLRQGGGADEGPEQTTSVASQQQQAAVVVRVPPGVMQRTTTRRDEHWLQRLCRIAGTAIRIIIGTILGDPTALIAAVVAGFFQ
ncbi:hypothetical protein E2562_020373 [Oryza meyeriana var. granulata]|uniref:DC1 domain-containing protein n=1 Tax=Oryza meyeriana var. granulata TaxID=110450 RepID=A0A6G1DL63_9ORYZ|nr:hypothetical protein E2562_020373 [Oryza meyeriana var. granulata]